LFSGSFSDDSCSLLKAPAEIGWFIVFLICSNNGFILICVFLSTLYVICLPYSRQHCAYNQPVYIFLFHVDFILEDIMVSRSLRQAIDPTNPELPDTPWFIQC
jgi:hypothetical protein